MKMNLLTTSVISAAMLVSLGTASFANNQLAQYRPSDRPGSRPTATVTVNPGTPGYNNNHYNNNSYNNSYNNEQNWQRNNPKGYSQLQRDRAQLKKDEDRYNWLKSQRRPTADQKREMKNLEKRIQQERQSVRQQEKQFGNYNHKR